MYCGTTKVAHAAWLIIGGVLLAIRLAIPAQAQYSPYETLTSPNAEKQGIFGWAVSASGDVNGDGTEDLLVGTPYETVGDKSNAGRAYVLSGVDGSPIQTLISPNAESDGRFGDAVAEIGDANGDGIEDLLIGAFNETGATDGAGRAYVFSGANGNLLQTLTSPNTERNGFFGVDLAGIGDVDGDGTKDLLIGAWGETVDGKDAAGRAYVFSGADGSLLQTLPSPNAESDAGFGVAVAGIGDADGEGTRDLLVGAPGERVDGKDAAGRAYVFSGTDGSLLQTLTSPNAEPSGSFGWALTGIGDADGDDTEDLLVGASRETASDKERAGRAYVFSGTDGGLLQTLTSPNAESEGYFGDEVAETGDADGDGTEDLLVGALDETVDGKFDAGRVYVFSGADGSLNQTLTSPNVESGAGFGRALAEIGDADGDGTEDLLIGSSGETGGGKDAAGHAYVFGSRVGIAASFSYPIGDKEEVPERLTPETNLLYPNNPVDNPARASSDAGAYWRNAQDVGHYNEGSDVGGIHAGEDWNYESGTADVGKPVYATANGQLFGVRTASEGGPDVGGYAIILEHEATSGKKYYSLYLHVVDRSSTDGQIKKPSVPDEVVKGQLIARIGDVDEEVYLPHLHFEIRDENWEDKSKLYPQDNENGYYTHDGGVYTGGMDDDQVEVAYDIMEEVGFLDPSDFIDAHSEEPIAFFSTEVASDGLVDFKRTGTSIDFSGVEGSGQVTVEKYGNGPTSTSGIDEENVGNRRVVVESDESLTFTDDTEVRLAAGEFDGINDPTNVTVYKRPTPWTGSFTELPTTYDSEAGELVATTGSFSEFVLASNTEPLPVELARFEGVVEGEEVLLKWETASEIQNSGFYVQRRSPGGQNWTRLTFVDGSGTTSTPRAYRHRDTDLPYEADSLVYRLKQVDADGSTSLSEPITVRREAPEEVKLLGTFPNPARNHTTVQYVLPREQEVTLRLYDVLGREVRTVVQAETKGRQERRFNTSSLHSGVYFLRLQAGGQTRTQKLMVVR